VNAPEPLGIALYLIPLLAIWLLYVSQRRRKEGQAFAVRDAALRAGMTQPPSLHPVINPSRCIGCAACVDACPEEEVLGLIQGKAQLINPTNCIGHGACKTACPTDAITLVFGTETRGVDIPMLSPAFETSVPGIFIAGELGGMGLIANAIEQGRQAIESIRKLDGIGRGPNSDVVIVGAGPAGFSASLAAMQHRLRYVTLEQDSLGGTVFQYPRAKVVMTTPGTLPVVGKVTFRETSKEQLLEFWRQVEKRTGVKINYKERVEEITKKGQVFQIKTTRATYHTRAVLLAIGRRGTPRKLGAPGEDRPRVVYRLIDPAQYRKQHVLVVGGGDSALEAATALADEAGTVVTLSYRGEAFTRAKEKNRQRVDRAAAARRLTVLMRSEVKQILDRGVQIEQDGTLKEVRSDAVIVSIGGDLPTAFLNRVGIEVQTKYGTA
jgi:thioredoxin reductase/NAD-dependent dihydropyrimidine dehydrogenase PreA subunit